MEHLINWIEIPVENLKRAKKFYSAILETSFQDMTIRDINYAFFASKDQYNSGALAEGPFYKPSSDGVLIHLNGGDDLDSVLSRVSEAGGNRIGVHSMK